MQARSLLTLMMLCMMSASQAAERECFDYGWRFRYMGASVPPESAGAAGAPASEAGHGPELAVDGEKSTRWAAPDGKPGHSITVNLGAARKVSSIVVHWEKANSFDVTVELGTKKRKLSRKMHVENSETLEIPLKNTALRTLKLTVTKGVSKSCWASIREIEFLDSDGKALDLTKIKAVQKSGPLAAEFDDDSFKKVQLPHDWAIESPFLVEKPNETGKLPWDGWGCYRKKLRVPEEFDEKKDRYYLDFDGVMSCPKVYVNGRFAGEWAYGYNSFRVDITPYLKAGVENVIAVQVSNLPLSTRWYPGAGIYRHVWLEKTGPVHLAHWPVYITTPDISEEKATVEVATRVCNTGPTQQEVTLHQSVGKTTAKPLKVVLEPGEEKEVHRHIRLNNPKLWSCETPHLYRLKTVLKANDTEIDSHETAFGVRSVEWRGDGFYLNGERVQIKGVCEHHDLGALGAAFHTRAYERKIEILKNMGCNSIRMTHNPPAPEVLDLCDKHGILVIDELFDIWESQKYDKVNGYHRYWPGWWRKDVRNFMLRDRNHPCIIAWSGGNEVPELNTARGAEVSDNLRAEIRQYDATRPYTVGCNSPAAMNNGFADTVDVFGFNYKPDLYGTFRDRHPGKPLYGSETNSCVASRDTYFFPLSWKVGMGARPFHVSAYGLFAAAWGTSPDIEMHAIQSNPHVAGEYVWTGFDYLGEPTPYNQDASNIGNFQGVSQAEKNAAMAELKKMGNKAPSRSSYFGIIDLAGFPKDTYYLYRSHWRPEEKTCHILPHWNWKGREGEVTPVMVFSSGDEAELFLNGKSQGVRRRGEGGDYQQKLTVCKNAFRFVWEDVKYTPGTLKVVVKKDGKPWAEAQRVTTGAATGVAAEVDRPVIAGDGCDLAYISLALVDKKGNVVPTDSRKVRFSISGPAKLVGFCNGDPTDHTCMQDKRQRFFNGRMIAIVRSTRNNAGKAVVTVQADNLPEITIPIQIESAGGKG